MDPYNKSSPSFKLPYMTDIKICACCGEVRPLSLCIFFIPLPAAAAIRMERQAPRGSPPSSIFSTDQTTPPTLEQSELFLLCKKCAQLAQTKRGFSIC